MTRWPSCSQHAPVDWGRQRRKGAQRAGRVAWVEVPACCFHLPAGSKLLLLPLLCMLPDRQLP
jgi:hypothetical protein